MFRVTVVTQRSAAASFICLVHLFGLLLFSFTACPLQLPILVLMSLFVFVVGPVPSEPFWLQLAVMTRIWCDIRNPLEIPTVPPYPTTGWWLCHSVFVRGVQGVADCQPCAV